MASDILSKETIADIKRAGQAFLASLKDYEDAEEFSEMILYGKAVTCPRGHYPAFMKLSISGTLMTKHIICHKCPETLPTDII